MTRESSLPLFQGPSGDREERGEGGEGIALMVHEQYEGARGADPFEGGQEEEEGRGVRETTQSEVDSEDADSALVGVHGAGKAKSVKEVEGIVIAETGSPCNAAVVVNAAATNSFEEGGESFPFGDEANTGAAGSVSLATAAVVEELRQSLRRRGGGEAIRVVTDAAPLPRSPPASPPLRRPPTPHSPAAFSTSSTSSPAQSTSPRNILLPARPAPRSVSGRQVRIRLLTRLHTHVVRILTRLQIQKISSTLCFCLQAPPLPPSRNPGPLLALEVSAVSSPSPSDSKPVPAVEHTPSPSYT
jgi:hypothetical protein